MLLSTELNPPGTPYGGCVLSLKTKLESTFKYQHGHHAPPPRRIGSTGVPRS